jgi:putrescine transport system ATP-binding protein
MNTLSERLPLERRLDDPWNNPREKPLIRIQGVTKSFGSRKALDNIHLSIYRKEFFSLLGPSGCGKTTLLRLLAGFERPDSGTIFIDNIDVSQTPPYRLPVNMVFQSYALFPHMTVEDNIAFELQRSGKWSRHQIHNRVGEMLDLVQLSGFEQRKPHQLSGGQSQRVALARALANEPKVLLLDEPLGALDKGLREKTQFELVNIQEKVGATFIMVTHDQEEAMTMSSRLGVMDHGLLRQIGTPGEVYEYPNSLSVARFIGSVNIFEGVICGADGEHALIQCADTDTELSVGYTASVPLGVHISIAVRPEKMVMSQKPFAIQHNTACGIVKDIAYLGDVSVYYVQLRSGKMVMATEPNIVRLAERPVTWDSEVFLHWAAENSLMLAV